MTYQLGLGCSIGIPLLHNVTKLGRHSGIHQRHPEGTCVLQKAYVTCYENIEGGKKNSNSWLFFLDSWQQVIQKGGQGMLCVFRTMTCMLYIW